MRAASLPLLSCALVAGACTFDRGGWFAELDPSLEARLVTDPGRDAGDGWHQLDTDFQVRFTRAEVAVDDLELLDLGGAAGSFDPAHPPPGYGLCHNGHCHADDGRLVSYEEIEAELAGGAGGATAVVDLTGAGTIDLVAGVSRELGCAPGCGLPLSQISRARMTVSALILEGSVRDGREPARLAGEVPLALAAGTVSLDGELELPADREHDPDVTLVLHFLPTAALLDGIDFAGAADPIVALEANLGETDLQASVSR